jgi:glycosyltransferase involved in cell wall biosynthesis
MATDDSVQAGHSDDLEGLVATLVTVSPRVRQSEARVGGLLHILGTRGAQVNLVSHLAYSNRFAIEREKTEGGVNVVTMCLPSGWPRALKGLLVAAFNFAYTLRYARTSQVVLTSCGSMLVNAPVIVAARLCRRPVIYDWLDLEVERIPRIVFRYLMRRATTVLGLSYFLCEEAREIGCRSVLYTPCFVDVNRFRVDDEARKKIRQDWGARDDDIIVGYAGVSTEQEGVAVLLEAIKGLRGRDSRVRVAVLGVPVHTGGRGNVDVAQLAETLQLGDAVIVMPPVVHAEVPNILAACDVLCAPKIDTAVNRASIPMKVIEYLSMGLPTVTTPVGELERIVTDGVNGFMAEPGDVGDLESVLEKVISDYEASQEVGRRGRMGVASEFGIDAVGRTITRLLSPYSRNESKAQDRS